MRFVVDASVAVKWFVPEQTGTEKANHLLYLFREERIGLVVEPELFLIEIGNALRRLAGEQKITYQEAEDGWADLLELAIPTVPDPIWL